MQTTFNVYNDPGHGWCKVPLAVIEAIGLTEGHFSGYSYRNGDNLYLEEDCDLGIFIKTYTEKTGKAPVFKDHYANNSSRIRNYDRVRSGPPYVEWAKARGYHV